MFIELYWLGLGRSGNCSCIASALMQPFFGLASHIPRSFGPNFLGGRLCIRAFQPFIFPGGSPVYINISGRISWGVACVY